MSLCTRCLSREPRPTTHAHLTREYARVLIPALRHVAYRHGYALTVHGSLGMDIDLVAVPWRDSHTDAAPLVEALIVAARAILGIAETRPDASCKKMPGGRLAWSIYLGPWGADVPYIDLSVVDRQAHPTPEAQEGR